jgi:hypothetical protein
VQETDFISIFVSRLNRTGIRYMITGSVACIIYGEPRMTHDIDLVLEVGSKNAATIARAFPLDDFYCPPLETLMMEAARPVRGRFNLIHLETGLRADVYTMGDGKQKVIRGEGGTSLAGPTRICDPAQTGIPPGGKVR